MRNRSRMLSLTASVALTLCFGSADAAIFDAGQALKATMLGAQANPYTDANGGVWTYGVTTAVTGGTVTPLGNPGSCWAPLLYGFPSDSSVPTIHVNTGAVPSAGGGLTNNGHTIMPNEIVLHTGDGSAPNAYVIIRFVVPRTGVYHVMATFRDVSVGGSTAVGVDVHMVVNGTEITNAVISAEEAVPSFTADLRSLPLRAKDTVDFVVGPNGTVPGSHGWDGTALRASITEQRPYQASLINLDFNGFQSNDTLPGKNATYTDAGAIGTDGDFWNTLTIPDRTRTSFSIPNLRVSDGATNSMVRFSLSAADAKPLGGDYNIAASGANPLMNDYVYISAYANTSETNILSISGLTPNADYDLYFYSNVRGRFEINGMVSNCDRGWFSSDGTKDYVVFNGIAADSSGSITGLFYSATSGSDAVFNGLQIVGSFPRQSADIVNLDIDGYDPAQETAPGPADTFSGAARIGRAGDYWNSQVIEDDTSVSSSNSKLKLADGITKSTASFNLGALGGGKIRTDRIEPNLAYNALMDDYVYVYTQTNQFTLSGLYPNTAYDLYFYCRTGSGRFIINEAVYDSIDICFPISEGGDCAVCPGIMADNNGAIAGIFCNSKPYGAGVFYGFQIIGPIPRLLLGTILLLE